MVLHAPIIVFSCMLAGNHCLQQVIVPIAGSWMPSFIKMFYSIIQKLLFERNFFISLFYYCFFLFKAQLEKKSCQDIIIVFLFSGSWKILPWDNLLEELSLTQLVCFFPLVVIFNQLGVNIALSLHPPQTRLINMQFIKSVNQSTSEKSLSCVSIIIFLTNYEVAKAN